MVYAFYFLFNAFATTAQRGYYIETLWSTLRSPSLSRSRGSVLVERIPQRFSVSMNARVSSKGGQGETASHKKKRG